MTKFKELRSESDVATNERSASHTRVRQPVAHQLNATCGTIVKHRLVHSSKYLHRKNLYSYTGHILIR